MCIIAIIAIILNQILSCKVFSVSHSGWSTVSPPCQVLWHADMASHWWKVSRPVDGCSSGHVRIVCLIAGCRLSWLFVVHVRHSSKGGVIKKMYILNKNIVHLIDDIFWNMGFKTETHGEKVLCLLYALCWLFALYMLCSLSWYFIV